MKKGGLSEGRRKAQKDAGDQSRYQVLPEAATKKDRLLQILDEQSFCALVEHITVFSKEDIRITFRNGSEICY